MVTLSKRREEMNFERRTEYQQKILVKGVMWLWNKLLENPEILGEKIFMHQMQ